MEFSFLKCSRCKGTFVFNRRTRTRKNNIYKCDTCGRELSVKRKHNVETPAEKNTQDS